VERAYGRPIGRGTIEKRKSKKGTYYRIRFSLGRNPETGKYEYSPSINVYGSKTQANDAAEEYRRQLLEAASDNHESISVAAYSDAWMLNRRASKAVKSITCDKDEVIIRNIKEHFGHLDLTDLDATGIKKTYAKLLSSKRMTPSGLTRMHKKFKQILDEAEAEGLIAGNPARNRGIKMPGQADPNRTSLSQEEAIRLRYCEHSPRDESRFMGIVIGLATGCRRGEILGLQWKHIHFEDEPYIRIEQQMAYKQVGYEAPKNSHSIRTIAIDTDTADALKTWRKTQANILEGIGVNQTAETPVVIDDNGEMHDANNYARWFREFCVRNGFAEYVDVDGKPISEQRYNERGFPVDKNGKPYSRSNRKPNTRRYYKGLKFHELRHTHITLQIGNGIDFKTVSERAGHKKTSTTMDIYTHAIPANDRVAANLISDILRR